MTRQMISTAFFNTHSNQELIRNGIVRSLVLLVLLFQSHFAYSGVFHLSRNNIDLECFVSINAKTFTGAWISFNISIISVQDKYAHVTYRCDEKHGKGTLFKGVYGCQASNASQGEKVNVNGSQGIHEISQNYGSSDDRSACLAIMEAAKPNFYLDNF